MRFLLLFVLMAGGVEASAQKLPKNCFGDYAGVMPAYDVVKNDVEMHIDEHDVKVSITETEIVYYSGSITVRGQYEFFKQDKSEYLIKASFSNGKNLSYQMDFIWSKKNNSIRINGKNGEPDVELEKLD